MRTHVILLALLLAFAAPVHAGLEATEAGIEFSYTDPSAASVALAGEFNGWSTNATPMTNDGTGADGPDVGFRGSAATDGWNNIVLTRG